MHWRYAYFKLKKILWYALERKVLSFSTKTLKMMFSLNFVVGSKSAEGGPNPPGHHRHYAYLSTLVLSTERSDKERRLTEFFYHYELLRIELNNK